MADANTLRSPVASLLQPLVRACRSAELTVCGLIRADRAPAEHGWAVNAFSVLTFRATALASGARTPKYLTGRPESSPDRKHKLFVAQTELSVQEALGLCSFSETFIDPRAPAGFGAISSPGAWVGPAFVDRGESTIRACLPTISRSLWLKECWQPRNAIQNEVGDKGVVWLQARIKELLGVSLAARRERMGNFLIALPEQRARMRIQPSLSKDVIGVEVQSAANGPAEFLIVARGSNDRHVVSAASRVGGAGLYVLPMASSIEYRDIELYDAQSGLILDREAGYPLRDFAVGMTLTTTHIDIQATFTRPDGTQDGDPVRVVTDWGSSQPIRIGGRPEWEEILDEVRAEEQREALRASEQFFVYRGESGERERAIADIRRLLHTRVSGFLKVWDPYFGHKDAFTFLFYVTDPQMPVRVLTSLDPTDEEEASLRAVQSAGGTATLTIADWKRQKMATTLAILRQPQPNAAGLTGLEVRSGGAAFHDRFIITDGRCWQLGCSFNQIGNVMSTIVEFPYPAMIEREFDIAWKRAKAI